MKNYVVRLTKKSGIVIDKTFSNPIDASKYRKIIGLRNTIVYEKIGDTINQYEK